MRRPEADPPPALDPSARTRRQDTVRTGCGREFVVGDFCLDQLARPAARVSLSTRRLPQDRDELWASFTPDEARRLAARLLAHAAEADAAAARGAGRSTARDGLKASRPAPSQW